MAKTKYEFSNPAFQKNESAIPAQYNLVTQTSSLNAVFDFKPLDAEEAKKIDWLLADNVTDATTKEQMLDDARKLKEVSAEIKAIGKQWVVLTGERIHRAREILKPYRDGTFTKWLDIAMTSRKTGYNMLSYYELYEELPHDDTRNQFKQIAQKPAYILASREGNIETKVEIIKKAKGMKAEELVTLIQEELPSAPEDKRSARSTNGKLIDTIRNALRKLQCNKDLLTKGDTLELLSLKELMNEVVA